MNDQTLTELRQLAAHLVSLEQQLCAGLDELHRRLSFEEDEQARRHEDMLSIARLSEERRRLRGEAS